jgi:hypothetical protein
MLFSWDSKERFLTKFINAKIRIFQTKPAYNCLKARLDRKSRAVTRPAAGRKLKPEVPRKSSIYFITEFKGTVA